MLSPIEIDAGRRRRPTQWAGFPNDPLYKKQWHMRQIGMPEAWKLADGNGVIVAVLDTGVAYENYGKFTQLEDLKGLTFVKPYDFVGNTKHANDDHGHGSHVTGTIAQVTNNGIGVAGVALQRQDHAAQGARRLAARARSPASPTRFATRPTTARRSSTCRSAVRSRRAC